MAQTGIHSSQLIDIPTLTPCTRVLALLLETFRLQNDLLQSKKKCRDSLSQEELVRRIMAAGG